MKKTIENKVCPIGTHKIVERIGYQENVGVLANCQEVGCGSTIVITDAYHHVGEGIYVLKIKTRREQR